MGAAKLPTFAAVALHRVGPAGPKMCLQGKNFKKSPNSRFLSTEQVFVRFPTQRMILNLVLGSIGRFLKMGVGGGGWPNQ